MAERVKVYENDAGELLARLPGSDRYIPITEEDVATLEEGNFEAFFHAADNAIKQAGTGARALISGALGAEETEAEALGRMGDLRHEQELRGGENPIVGFAGSMAPDAVLGAITGGGSAIGSTAGRMAATGAIEGALGAVRNPEDPVTAGLIQGTIGAGLAGVGPAIGAGRRAMHPYAERVSSRVRGVISRTSDDIPGIYRSPEGETGLLPAKNSPVAALDDMSGGEGAAARGGAVGADLTRSPEYTSGQMRGPNQMSAARMVDEYQYPLSKHQAAMIDATDDDAFEAARLADIEDEVRSRTGNVLSDLWDGKRTDRGALETGQRRAVRRNLASEIGQPQAQRLDRATVGDNLKRISADIGGIIEQSGPVRTKPVIDQWKHLLKRNEEGPAGTQLRRWIAQLEEKGGHTAAPQDVAAIRNRISEAMEWAGRTEPDPEAVQVFGAARTMLDQELKRKWSPDMQERFEELGYQWKLSQALVRGAKGALSDRNEVNPGVFMNNWRMLDNAVRTGRDRDNPFLQFMEMAAMAQMKEIPNSGTPAGIAAGLRRMGEDAIISKLGPLGNVLR